MTYRILFALSTLLLASCTVSPHTPTETVYDPKITAQANTLLARASHSEEDEQIAYQLQAAEILLNAHETTAATQVLINIPSGNDSATATMPPPLQMRSHLVHAQLALLENDPNTAVAELAMINTDNPDPNILPPDLQQRTYTLRAQAYQRTNNHIESARAYTELAALSQSEQARTRYYAHTWERLQHTSPTALQQALDQGAGDAFRGWLALALLNKQHHDDSQALVVALRTWQYDYPDHPGEKIFSLHRLDRLASSKPAQHIALLLPLDGRLAPSAEAIRDGFLAAYYADTGNPSRPEITLFDTQSDQAVAAAYQQAIAADADWILGPLSKDGVEQLQKMKDLPVPVLALNYTHTPPHANQPLYQFGLLPEDEARQVAERAWQDGHARALLLVPENEWGERVTEAFQTRWEALGGSLLRVQTFPNQGDLSPTVRQLLSIDSSEARISGLRGTLRLQMTADPRRRQDIDMVFIAADPQKARQLRPLLEFYYASDIPVYGTASLYTGKPSPQTDRDLQGVIFCDIPWLFDEQHALPLNEVESLWPEHFTPFARLYALGIDSYELLQNIDPLTQLPQFGLAGATGILTLNNQHQVERQLIWLQIKNGAPAKLDT